MAPGRRSGRDAGVISCKRGSEFLYKHIDGCDLEEVGGSLLPLSLADTVSPWSATEASNPQRVKGQGDTGQPTSRVSAAAANTCVGSSEDDRRVDGTVVRHVHTQTRDGTSPTAARNTKLMNKTNEKRGKTQNPKHTEKDLKMQKVEK